MAFDREYSYVLDYGNVLNSGNFYHRHGPRHYLVERLENGFMRAWKRSSPSAFHGSCLIWDTDPPIYIYIYIG